MRENLKGIHYLLMRNAKWRKALRYKDTLASLNEMVSAHLSGKRRYTFEGLVEVFNRAFELLEERGIDAQALSECRERLHHLGTLEKPWNLRFILWTVRAIPGSLPPEAPERDVVVLEYLFDLVEESYSA